MAWVDRAQGQEPVPVSARRAKQLARRHIIVQLFRDFDGHHDGLLDPVAVHPAQELGRRQTRITVPKLAEVNVRINHPQKIYIPSVLPAIPDGVDDLQANGLDRFVKIRVLVGGYLVLLPDR